MASRMLDNFSSSWEFHAMCGLGILNYLHFALQAVVLQVTQIFQTFSQPN